MPQKGPPQRRSAKDAASRMAAAGRSESTVLIETELQAAVKWHLAREANAADVIQRLSCRVDQSSALAHKARTYGAKLRLLVARIEALLPAEPRIPENASALGGCSEAVIQSLDAKAAASMLVQFLLHHAQTPSVVLMHAGERLRSKGFERLWQRAAREREKIAEWARQEQCRLSEGAGPPVTEPGQKGPPAQPEAGAATGDVRASDDGAAPAAGTASGVPRISYNPPQIVRWM